MSVFEMPHRTPCRTMSCHSSVAQLDRSILLQLMTTLVQRMVRTHSGYRR